MLNFRILTHQTRPSTSRRKEGRGRRMTLVLVTLVKEEMEERMDSASLRIRWQVATGGLANLEVEEMDLEEQETWWEEDKVSRTCSLVLVLGVEQALLTS